MACLPPGTGRGEAQEGCAQAQSSAALLADLITGVSEEDRLGRVVIGMDPHKRSATIEVIDERERVLDTGRFGTDHDGYRQMLVRGRRYPDRQAQRPGQVQARVPRLAQRTAC